MIQGLSCGLVLVAALSCGTGGAFAQAGMGSMDSGAGPSKAAPSVDTGAAGTPKFPVGESSDPKTTGSSIGGDPSVNPPGNPPGTIPPNADAATKAGASGKNPCIPESGQAVGNVNPSGSPSPSRC
jgi:hypothetical protein